MSDDELELDTLGDRKTALFLIMSDTDTTFNFVIAMLQSQLRGPSCRPATRPSQNFFWTLFLFMGKRSGACPCMTAKTR